MSSSGIRTKNAFRSEQFPTGLPRAHKIGPKSIRTIHEGGGQKSPKVFYCSLPAINRRLFLVYALSGLVCELVATPAEDLGGF